jgi:hypothetical protein
VAYFYQSEPHKAYPPLPVNAADLLPFMAPPPFKVDGAIEAERLVDKAKADTGDVKAQSMSSWDDQWSGDSQLWWTADKPNGAMTFQLPAPEAGTYQVTVYLTKAGDYGKFRVSVNGKAFPGEINLYNDGVEATGPLNVGPVRLKAGDNEITVTNIGKDPASKGYMFGLDCVVLTK